jgi:hypothetical protein
LCITAKLAADVSVGSFSSDRPAPDALGMSASLQSRPNLRTAAIRRFVPCVDGSGLARTFFTHAGWSVQPCVRPVSAVRMTAGHNALRGSGPDQKPAFEMHWHKWVVLTAGSTGSALRAVRPPNLHITPDVRRDLVRPLTRPGSCTARPWPSWPRPFGRVCWQARSQRLSLACAPTVR